jgi:hypothetical protein
MTRVQGSAIALVATILAAVALPRVAAAGPPAGADGSRAEVQIGLCTPADEIVRALDLRPRGTPIDVWHFDDGSLGLFGRGLRLRLRVGADGRSELTLKVADQDCARLDAKLVPPGEGKCEYDVYGMHKAGAASLTRRLDATKTSALLAGDIAPAEALSAAQIRYLRDVAGIWPLPPGIRPLGPMQVRTYRTRDKPYDIDISELPGGAKYAEISRKVPLADAARTMEIMETDLTRAGVHRCADQSPQAVDKLRSLLRQ